MQTLWLNIDSATVLYCFFFLLVASWLWAKLLYPDFRNIKGIPEIRGASLMYGHLNQLGNDHASTLQRWSSDNGWPIFQIRLGYRRVIVLNGFEVSKEWIVTNQAFTIDRPQFYTFHGVVSKTSGECQARRDMHVAILQLTVKQLLRSAQTPGTKAPGSRGVL